jgi:hypothetical protein
MGKNATDSVWKEWKAIGVVNGKRQYTCNYCNHQLQVNVTRFKHHLVHCSLTPEDVKLKFRETVCRQSLASKNQKRKLVAMIDDEDDVFPDRGSKRLRVTTDKGDSSIDLRECREQQPPLNDLHECHEPQVQQQLVRDTPGTLSGFKSNDPNANETEPMTLDMTGGDKPSCKHFRGFFDSVG